MTDEKILDQQNTTSDAIFDDELEFNTGPDNGDDDNWDDSDDAIGNVTLFADGKQESVPIYQDSELSNLAYAVAEAFDGAEIVPSDSENKDTATVIKRAGGGDTFVVTEDPSTIILQDGDEVYIGKLHENG